MQPEVFNQMFEAQRNSLLGAVDAAHDAYYRAEIFGGPSLHFHLKDIWGLYRRDNRAFAISTALQSTLMLSWLLGECTEWGLAGQKCANSTNSELRYR
jgi:hypothetical protein